MSNYIEYNDSIAFHPGYYVKEIVDESGLTQEDFAKKDEQIKEVRTFLNVATLSVFAKRDMAVSFRSPSQEISESNTVKANVMVQIAMNKALKKETPKYNKKKIGRLQNDGIVRFDDWTMKSLRHKYRVKTGI